MALREETDMKVDLHTYLTDERVRTQFEAQARRERAIHIHTAFASLAARAKAFLHWPDAPRRRAAHCG